MVPPSSHGIPRVPRYSGYHAPTLTFKYGTLTLFGLPSHAVLLVFVVFKVVRTPKALLLSVWPLPRSLATTYGISVDFFSSPYLDVSVQAVPLICLWIQHMIHGLLHVDSSIRKSAAHWIFAPPRGLSQLVTSFFGSQCQGIRPALFLA